jgi:hypothetical protein
MRLIAAAFVTVMLCLVSLPGARPRPRIECVAGCGADPIGSSARTVQLIEPFGVAFDRQGNWYICEYKVQRVTKVDTGGLSSHFAGKERNSSGPQGPTDSRLEFNDPLNRPHGVFVHSSGALYISDSDNHRVLKLSNW